VKHHTSPDFWDSFYVLPQSVQRLARRKFALLKDDPRHPSLHFKKIGQLWSVRVGLEYRALGLDKPDCVVWFWIGPHAEYENFLT